MWAKVSMETKTTSITTKALKIYFEAAYNPLLDKLFSVEVIFILYMH